MEVNEAKVAWFGPTKEPGPKWESFLSDWDFWMQPTSIWESTSDIQGQMVAFEKIDSATLTERQFKGLEGLAAGLWWQLSKLVTYRTLRFDFRDLIAPEHYVNDNPPKRWREKESENVPYLVGGSAITDKKYTRIVMVMQTHAAAVFAKPELIQGAEKFLKETMKGLIRYRAGWVIYGVLMIGGKVSFYQMDEEESFTRIENKWARDWIPAADKEALNFLIGLVNYAWWNVAPRRVKNAIKEIQSGKASAIVIQERCTDCGDDSDSDSD